MKINQTPTEVLINRRAEIHEQINRVESRMQKPPAFSHYDSRNDLSLNAELHNYLREINDELKRRGESSLTEPPTH